MRYVSLCSGIESTTIAWGNLGWTPLAFSEIDPFACAVLAYRFPDVPNLGDMMKIDWKEFHEQHGIIDVLFASTPCQSFSIAGNRLGLDGESGLMWGFVRAVRDLIDASEGTSPRYVVWENVPGCLSSGGKGKKGEDFRCLLEALDECGFGVSWRVLDSQFARIPDGQASGFRGPVPQRRRRVYLVGSLGSSGSEEILFERSCLQGNHPKSREAREALAEDITRSPDAGNCAGFKWYQGSAAKGIGYEVGVSPTLAVSDSHVPAIISVGSVRENAAIENDMCGTLDAGHEQPIVVIDRAAFNQGKNAQYPPHIEQTTLMDTLVARGPHAVCYRTETM